MLLMGLSYPLSSLISLSCSSNLNLDISGKNNGEHE